MNGEFAKRSDGTVELVGGGYFDEHFWGRKVAYPAYVDALVASGYQGYMDWEFCHQGLENGKPVGIEYVHKQTELAFTYISALRDSAERKTRLMLASSA
jgi:sugar phosphate isomerase/epimerase